MVKRSFKTKNNIALFYNDHGSLDLTYLPTGISYTANWLRMPSHVYLKDGKKYKTFTYLFAWK